MRRVGIGLAVAVVALLAVVAYRTLQPAEAGPPPEPTLASSPDPDAALARFARSLRIRTLSHAGDSGRELDREAFAAFHVFLEESYPRVHGSLRRETVSEWTLVYTWEGSEPGLDPVVLMGHFDVVPVSPQDAGLWTHPPFAGRVADGYLWGRGAIDDKINVIGLMEAAEALLARGFQPRRTLIFSFGHDEEIGGPEGAARVAELLDSRGVTPFLVLDEGGAVVDGVLPGADFPLAAVGVAEKGYVSVELTARTGGGHSSSPPADTSIGLLARAVARLEANPLPSRFGEVRDNGDAAPMRELLERAAPRMPLGYRTAFRNLWLFGPLVERVLAAQPQAGATLRTTTAPTIFHAGVKDNVLPASARAVVNFRIYPGDSIRSVEQHVRRVVDDPRIELALSEKQREASGVSPSEGPAWDLLARSIRQIYPEAVVAPYLILGGTDARHFRRLSDAVYGFMPVHAPGSDIARAHGNDERIAVDAFRDALRFYTQLLENTSR